MQWRVFAIVVLGIALMADAGRAQLPFHYFVDHTGKMQMVQIDGKPYAMRSLRQNDPLAPLQVKDTSAKVVRSEYTFDNAFEKLRTKASGTDTLLRDRLDYSNNIPIQGNYFTQGFPFWQDENNAPFTIPIQNGRYVYEHTYWHYTPERSISMPPPGPVGIISESYVRINTVWRLDTGYRIAEVAWQSRDSGSGSTDSALYRYTYTSNGLIEKIAHVVFLPGGQPPVSDEVFFFYTAFAMPRYVLCVANRENGIDAAYCDRLLDSMQKAEDLNDYLNYRDTPAISFFTAYRYDAGKRLTTCYNFDRSQRMLQLSVDSVSYNKRNLPDTIDHFTYKSKDQYGSRIIFRYNMQGKVTGTVENSSRQWFRNFKSEVAYPKRDTFTYDQQGRIRSVTTFYRRHPDLEYRYRYLPRTE
ncbi:MAG: hypothetical protein QM743_06910 [Chitinophagaceae bacterium]